RRARRPPGVEWCGAQLTDRARGGGTSASSSGWRRVAALTGSVSANRAVPQVHIQTRVAMPCTSIGSRGGGGGRAPGGGGPRGGCRARPAGGGARGGAGGCGGGGGGGDTTRGVEDRGQALLRGVLAGHPGRELEVVPTGLGGHAAPDGHGIASAEGWRLWS